MLNAMLFLSSQFILPPIFNVCCWQMSLDHNMRQRINFGLLTMIHRLINYVAILQYNYHLLTTTDQFGLMTRLFFFHFTCCVLLIRGQQQMPCFIIIAARLAAQGVMIFFLLDYEAGCCSFCVMRQKQMAVAEHRSRIKGLVR